MGLGTKEGGLETSADVCLAQVSRPVSCRFLATAESLGWALLAHDSSFKSIFLFRKFCSCLKMNNSLVTLYHVREGGVVTLKRKQHKTATKQHPHCARKISVVLGRCLQCCQPSPGFPLEVAPLHSVDSVFLSLRFSYFCRSVDLQPPEALWCGVPWIGGWCGRLVWKCGHHSQVQAIFNGRFPIFCVENARVRFFEARLSWIKRGWSTSSSLASIYYLRYAILNVFSHWYGTFCS